MKDMINSFKNMLVQSSNVTKDDIAKLLKTDPGMLVAFEKEYNKAAMELESDNFFDVNSRQAAKQNQLIDADEIQENCDTEELKKRIVDELIAQTKVYVYDGKKAEILKYPALPAETDMVSNEEILQLPEKLRPQLTGELMKIDVNGESYLAVLDMYQRYLKGKKKKDKRAMQYYHMFRQGLDILDLDSIMYEVIGTNPNSMGKWLPALVKACEKQNFFQLPKTTIAKVPLTLLQLTRQDYFALTKTTLDIVDGWAQEAFKLNPEKDYFIKTGTYSSKFDFRNARVCDPKEVMEIGQYLLFIHFQALQMASPLSKPVIYGVSTTNEWVVREFIPDKTGRPSIYKGLPLRTEYRVFVDCDTDKVIGISPYWEPNVMKNRFANGSDANSPHQMHDYVIYKTCEDALASDFDKNKERLVQKIEEMLPDLNLPGQWSIDIMQNGEDEFWLIDMALAENSAFYECVPKELRAPAEENWLPELRK